MSSLFKFIALSIVFCFSLSVYSDYQFPEWERRLRARIQQAHYRDTVMNELDHAFIQDISNKNLIFFTRIADDIMSDQTRTAMYVLFLNKLVSERDSLLMSSLLERAEEFGILQGVLSYQYGENGGTVLHHAITQQELKIVKTLLEHDMDLGIQNAQKKTAVEVAKGFVPPSQTDQTVRKGASKAIQIFQLVSEKAKQLQAQSKENPGNGCGTAFNPDSSSSSLE